MDGTMGSSGQFLPRGWCGLHEGLLLVWRCASVRSSKIQVLLTLWSGQSSLCCRLLALFFFCFSFLLIGLLAGLTACVACLPAPKLHVLRIGLGVDASFRDSCPLMYSVAWQQLKDDFPRTSATKLPLRSTISRNRLSVAL